MTQNNINFLKNIKVKISEPFDKVSISFLDHLSSELKKNKKIFQSPELFYLMLFCSKKNILKFKNSFKENQFRVGRGLAFHVCPNNVPINFVFSFIFGLLSGNTNIIKLTSQHSDEKKLILKCINRVFTMKKFFRLKKTNFFIEYNHDTNVDITKLVSAKSDSRIIWGGDATVNALRKIETPPRCIDINFSDRYSLSVINSKEMNNLPKNSINILARKFFYDVFTMNQMACNSPHFIFWVGQINPKIEKYFWNKVSEISKEKFKFDEVHVIRKYNNLIDKVMDLKFINKVNMYKNFLYVVNVNEKILNIENIRGESGTIFQIKIKNMNKLSKFIKKKCQTITYYGIQEKDFKNLIKKDSLLGADRIVEIGRAFDFDLNWDGFDTIKTLTRVVNFN